MNTFDENNQNPFESPEDFEELTDIDEHDLADWENDLDELDWDDDDFEEYEHLEIGKKAPNFNLPGYYKGEVGNHSLNDYEDQWRLLFFYPAAFGPICSSEIKALKEQNSEFQKIDLKIIAISVDNIFSHQAWSKEIGELPFPLLSDIKKEVTIKYDTLSEERGLSSRSSMVINPEGNIKHISINDFDSPSNIDSLLQTIKSLKEQS